ncbi:hypothetical protein SARC_10183 [Sphaeroforma arctica JP610]|uniref:Tr-type G domain-containing protein n=1 Tax=Sphaeroforma arctica JP610 TaxID=667725 RepID=A0A0L0FLJ6_9EUKA|nr:hypothetical protein SARC_10183 [Sphaeroforma arctica JP610]KNC77356.1 hypothetical protein SARC_10183 [Sphaeroforma arctica JP610]|eukprot:XP_014151258.1 hypothetical protein SARC_10183 [Sphaeroforma arctica JP610]
MNNMAFKGLSFLGAALKQNSKQLTGLLSSVRSTFRTGRISYATAAQADVTHHAKHIRNVAVIAHVDHGKTTLVDQLLGQCGTDVSEDRVMDSINLERERGITIMSKNTSVIWNDNLFNIVDTPGHQDFGGEVERVLSMVDGVLLVVDATEGPMAQTKFVLSKALQNNLRPLVVINKVDRDSARMNGEVEDELFELFLNLNASDEQMEFPILYASGKEGWCVNSPDDIANGKEKGMLPLYESIAGQVPPPSVDEDGPFSMLVTTLEHDNYVGRVMTGKVYSGTAKIGDRVKVLCRGGETPTVATHGSGKTGRDLVVDGKVTKVFRRRGLARIEIDEAIAGDIISIAGVTANVTDTIGAHAITTPIPSIAIDPPTIAMTFGVNDSPLGGKEGKELTSSKIKERLTKECENNVTLTLKSATEADKFEVHGRGELQLGILIEQMRREGFELGVSPPRILTRKNLDTNDVEEPWEEVTIDVPPQYSGSIINNMQERMGEMTSMKQDDHSARIVFEIPSKGLMGYRGQLKSQTSGSAVVNSIFKEYRTEKAIPSSEGEKGKLICTVDGQATSYALRDIEPRGELFIKPGDEVYKGMLIGECSKALDLEVNPTKGKKLTNMRASGNDEAIRLTPPRVMSLEDVIAYLAGDTKHSIEVTPTKVRLRRRDLSGATVRRGK